jgi:hypothetical protein
VILSGCVPLLPTSTLPKPKADGATAICCECAVDGRIVRKTKTKRKGAQGLTKPKLVTVHTYAVRHSARGGMVVLFHSSDRPAEAPSWGELLVGFSLGWRVFTRSRWDNLRRARGHESALCDFPSTAGYLVRKG